MRAGQPKCICAPKCRSNVDQIKRNANDKQQQYNNNDNSDIVHNGNIDRHRSNQRHRRTRKNRKSAQDDADDLFSSDVQFIDPINNRSIHVATIKSDRMISIMTSDSMQKLNSQSSRVKKTKQKHTNNNSKLNVNGDSNLNSKIIDNSNLIGKNDTVLMHHRDRHARKHNPHRNGIKQSLRLNDRNRSRQAQSFDSWEDKIRLGFYGHDSTYPSDDNSVRRNC